MRVSASRDHPHLIPLPLRERKVFKLSGRKRNTTKPGTKSLVRSLLRGSNVDSQRFGMSDDYFITLFNLAKSLDVFTDL